jgi:ketosteroid isomerase-like protein
MRSKNLAALTLTTLAFAACAGQTPEPQPPPPAPPPPATASAAPPPADTAPPPPPKPSLAELVPQTLKGIDVSFNAHDAKKMMSYFADDCVTQSYGMMSSGHGRDVATKDLQAFFEMSSDVKSAATRVWTKGNVAVVEYAWAGTMTGDFMGMKASKKPLGALRLHILWFNDDGLVKESHEYGDDATVMAQMKGAKGAPPVPVLPTNAPEVHVAKSTPDEDKLADWAKAATDDAFNKDDVKAALAVTADDADYWTNVSGGPATKGKKDLTKEFTVWLKAFPDQKWASTNAWGIDGYGIVEHAMSGTQKGPLGPLPASNKPVAGWHFVDIVQPSPDQKILHGWAFANMTELMAQTGALKAPGGEKAPAAAKEKGEKGEKAEKAEKPKAEGAKDDKEAPKKK